MMRLTILMPLFASVSRARRIFSSVSCWPRAFQVPVSAVRPGVSLFLYISRGSGLPTEAKPVIPVLEPFGPHVAPERIYLGLEITPRHLGRRHKAPGVVHGRRIRAFEVVADGGYHRCCSLVRAVISHLCLPVSRIQRDHLE